MIKILGSSKNSSVAIFNANCIAAMAEKTLGNDSVIKIAKESGVHYYSDKCESPYAKALNEQKSRML